MEILAGLKIVFRRKVFGFGFSLFGPRDELRNLNNPRSEIASRDRAGPELRLPERRMIDPGLFIETVVVTEYGHFTERRFIR